MKLFAIFMFSCAISVLTSATKFHIIEGIEAEAHSRPWMLSIEKRGQHNCGAALIRTGCSESSSNVAVTAAHCFERYCPSSENVIIIDGSHSLQKVRAGKHNLAKTETGQQSRKIVAVECHPGGYQRHDIAVLKFDSPIEFSGTIKPIELPKHEQVPNSNANCSFTGWGRTDKNGGGKLPDVLQALDVKPRSSHCANIYKQFDADAMFCMERATPGLDDEDATGCGGDSGSPLVCSNDAGGPILFGVVSAELPMFPENSCDVPGQAARVSHYVPWLHETIHALTGCKQ